MKQQRFGFTLVELLVVIGIIAILASLIFPSLNYARVSAMRTKCTANQGQVMKTILPVLVQDNNFMVSGDKTSVATSEKAPRWISYLVRTNRVQDLSAYRCPAMEYTTPANLTGKSDADKAASCAEAYGVTVATTTGKLPWSGSDAYTGFDFRGSKALTISGKDQVSPNMLALGGCAASIVNEEIKPQSTLDFNAAKGGAAAVHGDSTNLFFLDGHTETVVKEGYDGFFYTTGDEAKAISKTSWLDPNAD